MNCGSCNTSQVCGANGSCCAVESDAAFCQRLQKNCGSVSGVDTCGLARTANCGTCAGQQTCAGAGTANVCGQNLCGACETPPADTCRPPSSQEGYVSRTYEPVGTCSDPATGACSYASSTSTCTEDCRAGACVQTTCSLGGFECTTNRTGCKLTTAMQLRCLVVDSGGGQGMPCDEDVPGYRCDSYLQCVRPSFATTSICAHICASDAHCAGVGLQGQHLCVKSPGAVYGWCR